MEVEQTFKKDKFRGKLYSLTQDSEWKDIGTGFVAIQEGSEQQPNNRRLLFLEETDGKVLHDRPVAGEGTYQLQGEGERQTIIVWEDPHSGQDFAISFQEVVGTREIWQSLSTPPPQEVKRLLPVPTMGTLLTLSRHLMACPPSQRETVANECMDPKFIAALRECFHTAEDLASEEHLTQLWLISKGIFIVSNQRLTERYLQQDMFEDVMGMLEYDEGLPREKRLPHRQVLQVKVQFKDVLSFENQEVVDRIHVNYRLQYLKDIVLPRLLDDASFAALTQMIHSNLAQILEHLQSNLPLIQRLFQQLRQSDLQSLAFLQDVCRLAKILPIGERSALYEKFLQEKFFEVLVPYFSMKVSEASSTATPINPRHAAVEVLLLSTVHDASHLRTYLTSARNLRGRRGSDLNEFEENIPHPGRQLLSELINLMCTEVDQGVQSQVAELLKSVMDPTTLELHERDVALDVFYDEGALDELARPLRDISLPRRGPMRFAYQLICELLAFAVTHHGYRARVYIARHGIGQMACKLFSDEKNRSQQLAPIRLLKAMIASKDDAYHRYITKHGLFAPLMKCFEESLKPLGLGGNLLVSATLELLEMIRLENFKTLVDHICKKHGELLQEHVAKFKVLNMFFLRHQQNLEYEAFPPDQHSSGGPIQRAGGKARPITRKSPGRDDSDDDESYFESEDDDPVVDAPDNGSASPMQQGAPNGNANEAQTANEASAQTADVKDAPAAGQNGGLKGLLGYDDDDEEPNPDAVVADPTPDPAAEPDVPDAVVAEPAAAAPAPDAASVPVPDGGLEIETEEPKVEAAEMASSEDAAEASKENIASATTAPNAQEGDQLLIETVPDAAGDAATEGTDEDAARTPSAKAKAESKSLNHVVKRMKVNP